MKAYCKKLISGCWVVRVKLAHGDMAICECPGQWEAKFVVQCLKESTGAKVKSVRLAKMIEEMRETF